MADNKHPWRDVMSLDAWQKMLNFTKIAIGTNPQDPLNKISQQLTSYHQLEKPNRDIFPKRIEALKALEKEACQYLQEKNHDQYQRENSHKGGSNVNPRSLAARGKSNNNNASTPPPLIPQEKNIDRWVYSLAQRARKKAQYLEKLSHSLTGHLNSYSEFFDYLQRKSNSSADSELLSLRPGVKPEKWDPFHRPIELEANNNHQEFILKATHENAISYAFIVWYNSQTQKHFFEWLEGQPICTLTKYLDACDPSNFEFSRVQYGSSSKVREVFIKNGYLSAKPLTEEKSQCELLNTSGVAKNKSGEAYVWLKDGALLIHSHSVGTFHHSSFNRGRKVRCAGTIAVTGGKIERLDNSSGHYRPSTRHFLTLLEILNEHNAFSSDAKVETHDLFDIHQQDERQRIPLSPAKFLEEAKKKSLEPYSVSDLKNAFFFGA